MSKYVIFLSVIAVLIFNCDKPSTIENVIVYKEDGEILLLRFAQDLEELGKVEQLPKLEGKRMTIMMSPKTAKKKN